MQIAERKILCTAAAGASDKSCGEDDARIAVSDQAPADALLPSEIYKQMKVLRDNMFESDQDESDLDESDQDESDRDESDEDESDQDKSDQNEPDQDESDQVESDQAESQSTKHTGADARVSRSSPVHAGWDFTCCHRDTRARFEKNSPEHAVSVQRDSRCMSCAQDPLSVRQAWPQLFLHVAVAGVLPQMQLAAVRMTVWRLLVMHGPAPDLRSPAPGLQAPALLTVVTGVGLLRNHTACWAALKDLKDADLVKEYRASPNKGAIFIRLE